MRVSRLASRAVTLLFGLLVACGDNTSPGTLTVTLDSPTLGTGDTTSVTAAYSTGAPLGDVTWSSSNPAVATIMDPTDNPAMVTAVGLGTANIVVTIGGTTAQATLTVGSPTLTAIGITPPAPQLAAGTTAQLTATGTFGDGSTSDITSQVAWSSDTVAAATIDGSGVLTGVAAGSATITAALDGVSATANATVTGATLTSISVMPTDPTLAKGTTQQLIATGTFSDNTTQDLSTQVTWSSATEADVTVSATGLATAVATGSSVITATLGAASGTTTVTVTAATIVSLAVTPVTPSIMIHGTQQFTATATLTDLSTLNVSATATWSSSAPGVATVSTTGLATGVTAGMTTIMATVGGVSDHTVLTVAPATVVSIAVTPAAPTIPLLQTQQMTAMATYSDGDTVDVTTTATWSSGSPLVASVSNASGSNGLVTGLLPGMAAITATLDGVPGSTTVTVSPAALTSIAVTPTNPHTGPGNTVQLTATGTFSDGSMSDITATVAWSSGDPTTVTVSSTGLATTILQGSATITAMMGSVSGTDLVTVDPFAVAATLPAAGETEIRTTSPFAVTFNAAANPTTITAQTASGGCSGSFQVSADGFATCVGMTAAAPVMSAGNTVATFTPAAPLTALATYSIKVVDTVAAPGGSALLADFTLAPGFVVATDGTCAAGLVISQVYGAGGNNGATLDHDFIELHNGGASPIHLLGLSLQYASSTGTTWTAQALPDDVVPAGGYYLVQESGGANGTSLTTVAKPDFAPTSTLSLGSGAGKVALAVGTTALIGACPIADTLDFVGYGTANCFEGAAPTGAPTTTNAVFRGAAGCTDANVNSTDFTVAAVAPRNSMTTDDVCDCPAPQGSLAEVDYCNLQFPDSFSVTASTTSPTVYAQVYEQNDTEVAGPGPGITSEIGFGAGGSDPSLGGWSWFAASFNVDAGNNDEYMATFTAPATTGTYAYTSRFTRDGTNWTYCDIDGAGSNPGLSFDVTELGVMTVN